MSNPSRSLAVLTALLLSLSTLCFAGSTGEAVYKAKCQNCHGVSGMADTPVGLALKIKPVSDASVRKFTHSDMDNCTRNGIGKMQAFKDKLTDEEIKASVTYFRSLMQ
jgi:mono/diheme cytochrome c family protein